MSSKCSYGKHQELIAGFHELSRNTSWHFWDFIIIIIILWLYQKESRNERCSSPRERVLQSAHTENRCKSHCYRISLAERLTDGQLVSVRRNRNFLSNTLWAVRWHSAFQALPETNQLSSTHRTLSAVNKLGHLGARRGRAAPLASCG